MANIFAQGDTVVLDIFIFQFTGGPLVDPDGWNEADPGSSSEPTTSVVDPFGVTVQTATLAKRLSKGHFEFSFPTLSNAATGKWEFQWVFTVSGVLLPLEKRKECFKIANKSTISHEAESLSNTLRLRLKDNHPDPFKQRWNDTELNVFVENSLWDINGTAPAQTFFLLDGDNAYFKHVPEWKAIILDGAVIFSLMAQGIFEIGKEFSYSDNGISITIDRSAKYLNAHNTLMTTYESKKLLIKKQYFMNSLTPHVIQSGEETQFKLRTYAPQQFRIR